jgi:hypothetical protein
MVVGLIRDGGFYAKATAGDRQVAVQSTRLVRLAVLFPQSASEVRMSTLLPRRDFLQQAGSLAGAAALGLPAAVLSAVDAADRPKPKVAAIFTEFRFRSHAFNILENFLEPYVFNGKKVVPGVEVVSFYADQFPEKDLAREISQRYRIPLFPTIGEALCRGGGDLAVDAVLLIGEHGDYPFNELGQHQYPRKQFFDAIAAVCEKAKRGVPVFNDKHLSYRWDWAKEMYDTAKKLGIEMAIHGGGLESYDFHGLEVLQSMVENRRGGESGVSRVQMLEGPALWKAADAGRWSPAVAEAALAAEPGIAGKTLKELGGPQLRGILVDYKDGFRGTVLQVGSGSTRWDFACRFAAETEPRATHFYTGPWGNRNLFMALSHAIQKLFLEQRAPYPLERTLLTTGILEAAMRSHHQGDIALATPHLEFPYQPRDFRATREMGATWERITTETPEPKEIAPGGIAKLLEH